MTKAELKTQATDASVESFLLGIADEVARADCRELCRMMQAATGAPPRIWGSGIVGFGLLHLRYESGRELDWMRMGFAPRKGNLTLYLPGPVEFYASHLSRLGKHGLGKGCVYVKRLADVDGGVLAELLSEAARA